MDAKTMELKMKQWLLIFETQAQSGMAKEKWCDENGVKRWDFFKWQRKIRKYQLDQNQVQPGAAVPYLSAAPGFVDITPALTGSPAVRDDESETIAGTANAYKHTAEPVPSIHIRYGGFTIELPGHMDERLLSIVLKGVKDVD